MRKAIVLPATALLGGVAGFFLRRWELATAFEADTGLPIPNAPAFWALVLLSLAVAAGLAFFLRGTHKATQGGYDQAFAAKGNTVYVTITVLAAFLLLAAAVTMLATLPEAYTAAAYTAAQSGKSGLSALLTVLPKVVMALLALGSFAGILGLGRNSYRGEGKGKYSLPLLLPGYLTAFWLITAYQSHAGDPIRQVYIYKMFAILAILLALCFMADYSFEKGKFFRTAISSLLAVYFSLVTLADKPDMTTALLLGGFILYLTAAVTALIYNDELRMAHPAPGQAEDETEIKTEELTDEG